MDVVSLHRSSYSLLYLCAERVLIELCMRKDKSTSALHSGKKRRETWQQRKDCNCKASEVKQNKMAEEAVIIRPPTAHRSLGISFCETQKAPKEEAPQIKSQQLICDKGQEPIAGPRVMIPPTQQNFLQGESLRQTVRRKEGKRNEKEKQEQR